MDKANTPIRTVGVSLFLDGARKVTVNLVLTECILYSTKKRRSSLSGIVQSLPFHLVLCGLGIISMIWIWNQLMIPTLPVVMKQIILQAEMLPQLLQLHQLLPPLPLQPQEEPLLIQEIPPIKLMPLKSQRRRHQRRRSFQSQVLQRLSPLLTLMMMPKEMTFHGISTKKKTTKDLKLKKK